MPRYCFTTFHGDLTIEHRISLECEIPEIVVLSTGEAAYRDFRAEWTNRNFCGDLYPRASDAAGIHPSQIKRAMEADKKAGVQARYLPDGRVVFESRKHEKAFLEAHGIYHRNSYGYGKDADREAANRSLHSWRHPMHQEDVDAGC